MGQANIDSNVKFANWNPFYQDLAQALKTIRKVGETLYLKSTVDVIQLYYSLVVNLHSGYSQALKKPKMIKKELDAIEKIIFSAKYIDGKDNNNVDPSFDRLIIKRLMKIYQTMCFEFSRAGLTPKVNISIIDDPKDAILR